MPATVGKIGPPKFFVKEYPRLTRGLKVVSSGLLHGSYLIAGPLLIIGSIKCGFVDFNLALDILRSAVLPSALALGGLIKIGIWRLEKRKINADRIDEINKKSDAEGKRLQKLVSDMTAAKHNEDWPLTFRIATEIQKSVSDKNPLRTLADTCAAKTKAEGEKVLELLRKLHQTNNLKAAQDFSKDLIKLISPALARERTILIDLVVNSQFAVLEGRLREHFKPILVPVLNNEYESAMTQKNSAAAKRAAEELLVLGEASAADKLADIP